MKKVFSVSAQRLRLVGGGLAVISSMIMACAMYAPEEASMHPFTQVLPPICDELPRLEPWRVSESSPALKAYRDYYQLLFDGATHIGGTFQSGPYTLTANIFAPSDPQGTVFLMHGYLDHTGMLRHLIRNCLDQQFVVAMYDLPGHGLSSGARASIQDFSEYAATLRDFLALCQSSLPRPFHAISHSTGSAIVLDFLSDTPAPPFERIIFLAPLVRYKHWHLSKFAYTLGRPFGIKTVPRRYAAAEGLPELLRMMKTDPLQTDRVPLDWVGAVHDWNRDIQKVDIIQHPVLVIQGTDDDVVDWEYNIPFLREKLAAADILWLDDAGHQLANAAPAVRSDVFASINGYLLEK